MQTNKLSIGLFIGCCLVFVSAFIILFVTLYGRGLLYPAYSSLSNEPRGTAALYESFEQMPGVTVQRAYEPFERLQHADHYTHIAAGLPASLVWRFPKKTFDAIDSALVAGARIVMCINPARTFLSTSSFFSDSVADSSTVKQRPDSIFAAKKDSLLQRYEYENALVSLGKQWHFNVNDDGFPPDTNGKPAVSIMVHADQPGIEDSIVWLSESFFEGLDSLWRVLYLRDTLPVMIERTIGRGTLVLSCDGYFLTNEALAFCRAPKLLASLAGRHTQLLFHEAHLGIVKQTGLLALLNRYHCMGFFCGVILLMALYIYKNANPLIRVTDASEMQQSNISCIQEHEGLRLMLGKSIDAHTILSASIAEWRKSSPYTRKQTEELYGKIEATISTVDSKAQTHTSQISGYNAICSICSHYRATAHHEENHLLTMKGRTTSD
ncbi:MAG: hypothetical protein JW795_19725 [Chitinivibrionales bacterium]|nr:hypothetical protein [Chitinivibrionales bacterium]